MPSNKWWSFLLLILMKLVDMWSLPGIWVLVVWSVSNPVLLAQLPGREGATAREDRALLALFFLLFGSQGSGRKRLLCTWERSVVQILSAFLQPETMQMILQIRLRSCWQFWSTALFVRWWCRHLFSVHCPAQNRAHGLLHNWLCTLFSTSHREQVSVCPNSLHEVISPFTALGSFVCQSQPLGLLPAHTRKIRVSFPFSMQGWQRRGAWLWKLCNKLLQQIPRWDCSGNGRLSCLFCLSENFCEVIFNIFECPFCVQRHLCHKGKPSSIPKRIWKEKPALTQDQGVGLWLWNWLRGVLWRRWGRSPVAEGGPNALVSQLHWGFSSRHYLCESIISACLQCASV